MSVSVHLDLRAFPCEMSLSSASCPESVPLRTGTVLMCDKANGCSEQFGRGRPQMALLEALVQ